VWAAESRYYAASALEVVGKELRLPVWEVLGKEERLPVWEVEGKEEKALVWAGPWM